MKTPHARSLLPGKDTKRIVTTGQGKRARGGQRMQRGGVFLSSLQYRMFFGLVMVLRAVLSQSVDCRSAQLPLSHLRPDLNDGFMFPKHGMEGG